jgi:hypothetical protein
MLINMALHLIDITTLLLYVFCCLLSLVGWGSLVNRLIGVSTQTTANISDAWTGLFAVIALVETCHLVVPIDWKITLIFLAMGYFEIIRLALHRIDFQHSSTKIPLRINPFLYVIGFVFLLIAASFAITTPINYDSALYHFQSVRWLNESPIVLGLANLHGRLGFNQSYFSFIALLNFYPILNKGHAIGGLLMLVMASATLLEARLDRIRGGWWLNIWFFVVFIGLYVQLSSPTPDIAVTALECCIFLFLIKIYSSDFQSREILTTNVVRIFLLSCVLVTIKLSAAIFSIMSILLILPFIQSTFTSHKKIYIYTSLFGCYLVLLHLTRGVLTSGLPLYPNALFAFWDFDWSVSPDQARGELSWIYSWARTPLKEPSEVLGSWLWFSGWVQRLSQTQWVYIYSTLVLINLNLISLLIFKKYFKEWRLLVLYIPLISSVLFWFFTAPDWRFLGAIPTLLIALAGFVIIRCCTSVGSRLSFYKFPSYLAPSLVGAVILLTIESVDFKNLTLSGWRPVPVVETDQKLTASGASIFMPRTGDGCWNAPLPCTPYLNSRLVLKREDHLIPQRLTWRFSITQ